MECPIHSFELYLHPSKNHYCYSMNNKSLKISLTRISVGVVVKLLARGARGPGFDSWSSRYGFSDWLSPASKLRYGLDIAKAT